jgi:hypothetical protein
MMIYDKCHGGIGHEERWVPSQFLCWFFTQESIDLCPQILTQIDNQPFEYCLFLISIKKLIVELGKTEYLGSVLKLTI